MPIICAGTVITEWGEGTIFWDDVLSSEGKLQNFISVLVTIAKTLKFDGWLLNIENKVKVQILIDIKVQIHTNKISNCSFAI